MTAFDRRVLEIEPFSSLEQERSTWDDAIVFVLAGAIEVTCAAGGHECFRCGDILCLTRFAVREVRNPTASATRLLLVSRRTG